MVQLELRIKQAKAARRYDDVQILTTLLKQAKERKVSAVDQNEREYMEKAVSSYYFQFLALIDKILNPTCLLIN